ncbi:MAG: PepSY domain-containing protein [Actinomycetota bacterium]
MTHGPGETLLTGTTADKVEAAALDAVPGGTIIRVETDSDGSPYEAHVEKADGSDVTVKVDASFTVTDTIDGFGGAPQAPGSTATGA